MSDFNEKPKQGGLGVEYGASSLLRDVSTIPEGAATSIAVYENMTLAAAKPTVQISNNTTDANNDIDFSIGLAWDKVAYTPMYLSSAMTKRLDASFAAGTNQGGLFSGAKAVSTWYYCFLIRKTSDGSIDCGFSTSATASDIPAGYSGYAFVGFAGTDASGNIYGGKWRKNNTNFFFKAQVVPVNNADISTAADQLYSLGVPPNSLAFGILSAGTAALNQWVIISMNDPYSDSLLPVVSIDLGTYRGLASAYASAGFNNTTTSWFACWTNSSGQVKMRRLNNYYDATRRTTAQVWGYEIE